MQSVKWMQWISLSLSAAIGGIGFAPVAEYFGLTLLMNIMLGIGYIATFFLCFAALIIGGMAIHHGYLVVMGKEVPTMDDSSEIRK